MYCFFFLFFFIPFKYGRVFLLILSNTVVYSLSPPRLLSIVLSGLIFLFLNSPYTGIIYSFLPFFLIFFSFVDFFLISHSSLWCLFFIHFFGSFFFFYFPSYCSPCKKKFHSPHPDVYFSLYFPGHAIRFLNLHSILFVYSSMGPKFVQRLMIREMKSYYYAKPAKC